MNKLDNASEMPVAIYNLTIYGKSQTRQLKDIAADIAAENEAEAGAVKTNLDNLPPVFIKALKSAEGKIRNLFKKHGIQIGKATYAIPLGIIAWFKNELDTLVSDYNVYHFRIVESAEKGELIELIKKHQGDLFNADKVPSVEEIKTGFGTDIRLFINLESATCNSALAILAADLRDTLTAKVKADIEKENAEKLDAAGEKIKGEITKLLNAILKFDTTETKGLHGKSVADQVQRVIEILPHYNVTNDANITKLLDEVKNNFGKLDKDNIKEDEPLRKAAIEAAKGMKQMLF